MVSANTPIPSSNSEPRLGWPAASVEIGYLLVLVAAMVLKAPHDVLLALITVYGSVRGGALARKALTGYHGRTGDGG